MQDSPTSRFLDRIADEVSSAASFNAELPSGSTLREAVGLAEHLMRTVSVYLGEYGEEADQRAYLRELEAFVGLYDRMEAARS